MHRIPFIAVSIYGALIQIQIGYRYGDLGYNITFLEIQDMDTDMAFLFFSLEHFSGNEVQKTFMLESKKTNELYEIMDLISSIC